MFHWFLTASYEVWGSNSDHSRNSLGVSASDAHAVYRYSAVHKYILCISCRKKGGKGKAGNGWSHKNWRHYHLNSPTCFELMAQPLFSLVVACKGLGDYRIPTIQISSCHLRLVQAWTKTFKLSTSQTPNRIYEVVGLNSLNYPMCNGGFGPSCHDGYGISYIIYGDTMGECHIIN